MMTLKHTVVMRKGSSEPVQRFRTEVDAVAMHTGYDDTERRELWLAFSASASGGNPDTPGMTNYRILISTEDYAAILKAMCDVDEGAALSAMAEELAERLRVNADSCGKSD